MNSLQSLSIFSGDQYKNKPSLQFTTSGKLNRHQLYYLLFIKSTSHQYQANTISNKLIQILDKYFQKHDLITFSHFDQVLKKLKSIKARYAQFDICLLHLKKEHENYKLTLIGEGDIVCRLYSKKGNFNLPITSKGLTGYLNAKDSIFLYHPHYLEYFQKDIDTKISSKLLSKIKSKLNKLNNPPLTNFLFISSKKPFLGFKKLQIKKTPKFNLKINKQRILKLIGKRHINRKISHKRLIALVISATFLLLLGFSLGYGKYKKNKFEREKLEDDLIQTISYKLDQAKTLKNLNPGRAKSLLQDARDSLETYESYQLSEGKISNLKNQLAQSYSQVTQKYLIDNPSIFYDFSLLSNDLFPQEIALTELELSYFSQNKQTLGILDLENKSGRLIANEDINSSYNQLASLEDWIFLSTKNSILVIDKKTNKTIDKFKLEKINIDQLIGYASNAYIIDKNNNQVWRLRGAGNTLKSPQPFFNHELDLYYTHSFSVDGSVWLLFQDGSIAKYTSSVKDAYFPEYGLDIPLNPDQFFTDDFSDNLYILDKTNKRIVVISKSGIYQGQYLWDKIAESQAFVVSEELGKILILIDNLLYEINLN
jgi:hypothetical protein